MYFIDMQRSAAFSATLQDKIEHFKVISDPRINRTKKHNLLDILVVSVCAIIGKCETWVDIEEYGHARKEWFRTFLELPNGIPSHDTFGRVFSLIDRTSSLLPTSKFRALILG
ncbi:MAG: transposase family protein [Bdellovibrionota bacterium]